MTESSNLFSQGGQILDRIDQEIDIFESLEFDSFAALAQAVFGQWQFKTADTSDPLNFETYLFTVQSFELSDITVLRPQIFQPANGSVVDFPIQVRWDPSFRSYQFKGFGLQGNVTSIARGVLDVDLEVFPGSVNPYFTFEIISGSQLLSQYVLPVTTPIDPEFNLTIRSGFSRVANITIYPRLVPEPHSLTLLTMCMISLLALLRDPRVSA